MARSLRSLVLVVVVVVAVLPVPLVAILQSVGEAREETVGRAARTAAAEAREALERGATADRAASESAARSNVRTRVFDARSRALLADVDRDPRVATYGGLASIPLEDERDVEAERDPFDRSVVRSALAHRAASACTHDRGGALLICEAAESDAAHQKIVYVSRSARSDAQRLASTQRPLAVLTAFVLASGLALAWWLIARIARPLDALRRALAERATDARTATTPVVIDAPTEVAEVVSAHNRVLAALRDERTEKEQLSAELVHEIKSPLAAIRIAIEQLDERKAQPALEAVKRIDRTVAMLLELSRAEAGLGDEPREACALRPLVDAAVSAVAEREGVTFERTGDATAHVARESVRRALQCTIDNACSFAKSKVTVTLVERDGDAVITVSDDGAGIEPAHLPRVFERFFSGRREAGGTGIGLALVRAVVEAHGGTATARSTAGEGATFELRFPTQNRAQG